MNCRPGQMAYIVAPYAAEARGAVVRTVRLADEDVIIDGTCYYAESGRAGWIVQGRFEVHGVARDGAVIADDCLRPFADPDPAEVTSTTREAETCK